MSQNAKILSAIAGVFLLAALALVLFTSTGLRQGQGSAGASASQDRGDTMTIAAGKLAPDFKLPDLQGKEVSLASLRGKVVFLNLWATWCPPCRGEMPSIQSLYSDFHADKDFVVLAVSEDAEVKPVPTYIKEHQFAFTVLLDPRNIVGEAYNVSGLPESFVIGRDGRIVAHHVGPYDWGNADMRSALQDLLKAKQG